jgi:hypothetical protein
MVPKNRIIFFLLHSMAMANMFVVVKHLGSDYLSEMETLPVAA